MAARRDRRTRLVAFLIKFGPNNGVKVGCYRLPWTFLTDDGLEQVAEGVIYDFWSRRRSNRISQAHYAAQVAAEIYRRAA